MNDIEMHLDFYLHDYQLKHHGNVHPKDVIEALEGCLRNWKFSYGEKGEKAKFCPIDGYYCECDK